MKYKKFAVAAGMILLLSGCSFAPKFTTPKMDLPAEHNNKTVQKQVVNTDWWKSFNDETLNELIDEALKNSDDLHLAIARVDEARAYLGLKSANLYPAVSASASHTRQQTSKEMSPFKQSATTSSYTLSSSVSYELDLWGKLRNQKKAALASLLSTEAARETVKLTLVSSAANAYFNLVSIGEQLNIAKNTEESYKKTYEYRKKQYKYGEINELVVVQAKAQYENAKVLVESLKNQRATTMSALSVMLGKSPKEIFSNGVFFNKALPDPIKVPAALPSLILENRPDIKEAKENLKAKNALVGVAKAAYFPSISLTGILGFQSLELSDFVQRSAKFWSLTPSAGVNILDFGRMSSNVKVAQAQKGQAVIQYKKTVRNAFREVFDALNTLKSDKNKVDARKKEVQALKRTLELSKQRFEAGAADYLEVLDAQRGYLSARLNLNNLESKVLADQVTLYKTLGGGWNSDDSKTDNTLELK